jgi:hypothetical protein
LSKELNPLYFLQEYTKTQIHGPRFLWNFDGEKDNDGSIDNYIEAHDFLVRFLVNFPITSIFVKPSKTIHYRKKYIPE